MCVFVCYIDFYLFERLILVANKRGSFKVLDLEMMFEKKRESLRHWTLKQSSQVRKAERIVKALHLEGSFKFERRRESLRRWTLNDLFKFERRRELLRRWTLKRSSQAIF